MKSEAVLNKLKNAVSFLDSDAVKEVAEETLNQGIDPLVAIEQGLAEGLRMVGERFERGEAFLTELIIAAETMKVGLEVLSPTLERLKKERKAASRVVIGTVAGDIHDLGKNLVALMLEINGFNVLDLGVDVPVEKFIEAVKDYKPDILGLSALLTTTIRVQKEVIDALKRSGLRGKVKVMVGGAPVSEEWAKEIGADTYGIDAIDAVRKAKALQSRARYLPT